MLFLPTKEKGFSIFVDDFYKCIKRNGYVEVRMNLLYGHMYVCVFRHTLSLSLSPSMRKVYIHICITRQFEPNSHSNHVARENK